MKQTAVSNKLTELERRAIAWLLFLLLLTATVWLLTPSSALATSSQAQQSESKLFTRTDLFAGASPIAKQTTTLTATSICWGDFDNDGDLDILLSGFTNIGAVAQIQANDGSGVFSDIGAGLPNMRDCSVAWGDYDNDGDLDILLTGADANGALARVYRNDGGIFTDIGAGLPGLSYCSVAWGDYDNDGDLDILLTGITSSGSISEIYRNDAGSFSAIGAGMPGVAFSSVAWGDYDKDGDLDILLTGDTGSGYITRIYRNDGGGTFTNASLGLPGVAYGSVAWGDYDNDGDLDFLLTGDTGTAYLSVVYQNLGSGTFVPTAGLTAVAKSSVAWGDYDKDGDLDILLSGDTGTEIVTLIYRNNGDNSFTDIEAGLPGVCDSSVAWGDDDNDGDLDFVILGYTGSDFLIAIFRNTSSGSNVAPSAPTNLAATVDGGAITFSWDPASDDTTPAAGLSYNLRVGSAPGAGDILSGMADVNTGYRRVVQLGNTNQRTSWTLHLPAEGDYFFSVQAIDASFLASPFAMEIATGVPEGAPLPRSFVLHAAAPNPFNPRTTIRYDLPHDARVKLRVYDIAGRLVRTLIAGQKIAAGQREAMWDGRDEAGRSLASGVYVCRLDVGEYQQAIRMTLLK